MGEPPVSSGSACVHCCRNPPTPFGLMAVSFGLTPLRCGSWPYTGQSVPVADAAVAVEAGPAGVPAAGARAVAGLGAMAAGVRSAIPDIAGVAIAAKEPACCTGVARFGVDLLHAASSSASTGKTMTRARPRPDISRLRYPSARGAESFLARALVACLIRSRAQVAGRRQRREQSAARG